MATGHRNYQFTIDEAIYGTAAKVMDGGQIREAAGRLPASDFILIQIAAGSGRSIGLEDEVKFVEGETAKFLSFRSDRIFTFTVNERGWEWGAATISAADIYSYAEIDHEHELVLEREGYTVIPLEGEVDLAARGVERILSRETKTVTIKVNGRSRTVERRRYSYREIAAIAYPNPDFENFNYTTTYLHGVNGAEGDLVEGESIKVKNGMVFNVRRSDKS